VTRLSRRFPTDPTLTRLADAALKRHLSEVRDYTWRFHERWKRWGVTTIRGTGWALRPFFVPAAVLDFVAASLHARLVGLTAHLRTLASKRGALSRALPLPDGFEAAVEVGEGLASPTWLAHLRPDGFLFEDRFILSELNFGNGMAVSTGYTELVDDYWSGHPVLRRLGLDVARMHRRPLPRYLEVIRRALRPSARPFVALLAHSEEWDVILSYPPRVLHQFEYVQRELYRLGIESRIVTEDELGAGRDGNPRVVGDARRPDLVMFVTIGGTFLDRPKLLEPGGRLAHLRGARIGDIALVKPLAAALMDKGILPMMHTLERHFAPRSVNGFRFEVAPTHFPDGRRYARGDWVLKRAFAGKETYVGPSTPPDRWATIVAEVTRGNDYVAQRYVSMPRARIPVLVDEKHLEWVDSRVELSSFIYDGAFAGGAARHAPDAEGLVMSNPPEGYGFSTVFAV
jgi:hypothetical protein